MNRERMRLQGIITSINKARVRTKDAAVKEYLDMALSITSNEYKVEGYKNKRNAAKSDENIRD